MQAPPEYNPPTDTIEIIFQDDDLVVVNKPPGLLSVPGKSADLADCLQKRIRDQFHDTHLVHRLDMDTSGLMVFARKKRAQRDLNAQFEKRSVDKTYIALVSGIVNQDKGTIDHPLRTDWPNRPLQMVADDGKPATTYWQVLERRRNDTRVSLKPKTGRTHQLRVHMKSLGHPILGDRFYAEPRTLVDYPRLYLHAAKLSFQHPSTGKIVSFDVPAAF